MLAKITHETMRTIDNPVFRDQAQIYLDIEDDFMEQIASTGLPLSPQPPTGLSESRRRQLVSNGLCIENNSHSFRKGWVSPSCKTCAKGVGTKTYLISVQCPKNCYYCFNPNQADYDYLLDHTNDVAAELQADFEQGFSYTDIALTGGEPLLHAQQTFAFFALAKELFPQAYLRLYTSGAGLHDETLQKLQEAGLDEIRFSIKMEGGEDEIARTLGLIEKSKPYLSRIVVEMPVFPDNLERMKRLLMQLDELGIDGINLLEFCFPFNNADVFASHGYMLKSSAFEVLYNYWYAGGLPVAGSEERCFELLEFACENNLAMGIHYCSLENKNTGQVYQQNSPYKDRFPFCVFSERDFFLKSAKVFGDDCEPVKRCLDERGMKNYWHDDDCGILTFTPEYIPALVEPYPNVEMGLSYQIVESQENGLSLKELRIDKTTPLLFDGRNDL